MFVQKTNQVEEKSEKIHVDVRNSGRSELKELLSQYADNNPKEILLVTLNNAIKLEKNFNLVEKKLDSSNHAPTQQCEQSLAQGKRKFLDTK